MSLQPFAPAPGGGVPFLASDNGLLSASGNMEAASSTFLMVAGTVYLAKMQPRGPITISSLLFALTTAGVGASSGSFAGAYSPAGQLLAQSADIGASLLATPGFSAPMTTPASAAPYPWYWAAIVANLATTQPTLARFGASSAATNMGLAASSLRFAIAATGQTTLPASITPGSNTSTPNAMAVGST